MRTARRPTNAYFMFLLPISLWYISVHRNCTD
jgi:hypothetical protein